MSNVKHAFTNPKSDGADATITRPSDWNAEHVTTETSRTKRLAPDGAGAMEWVQDIPAAAKVFAYITWR